MPKIAYINRKFNTASLGMILQANAIIVEYQQQGFTLTLRQLYYQFVARDMIPNTSKAYSRLQGIISTARKAGMIDWQAIEDRTRAPVSNSHWTTPESIIESAANAYQIDKWSDQPNRVEVWIEKDALVGVIEQTCRDLDVTYFSCRGYSSDPPVWNAAQRFMEYEGQNVTVLHLGDHDPSGIDMTRDIADRLYMFESDVTVERIALTMSQIEQYGPPPNPAKISDSRYDNYVTQFGEKSWELDALEPAVISDLVRGHVEGLRDEKLWQAAVGREDVERATLTGIANQYEDITTFLEK